MAKTHAQGGPPAAVAPGENCLTSLWRRAESEGGRPILRYAEAGGGWGTVTWAELAERVRGIAGGLLALGVEPGDPVGLMSGTRLEWTVADLAILAAGGVTVPIYETSSADQCGWILSDSRAKVAIAGSADNAKVIEAAREQSADLGEVFVIDDGGLVALADRGEDSHRAAVAERSASVGEDALASIIYTSGTTGNPKGCMLTHGNLLWTARQSGIVLSAMLTDEDSTLMFLPLAHVFARIVQFLFLESDVEIGYARSTDTLVDDLQTFRPTFLLSVPRVFEKVFNGAQRKATGAKRRVFDFAVATSQEWGQAENPGVLTNLKRGLCDRLVYSKLREALGGRVNYCVSGGAPLAPYLAHFFRAADITVLEGYGLTETTAPATVNTPDAVRIGTVGRPLPGVEIRTDGNGEILINGGNVFRGYFRNDDATREVLEDGWFRSGDLGEIDDDGFLRITGRRKEIIVTAQGKNVAPAVLEERLKSNRLISQAMVVGDDRPFVAALITLDPEELAAFAAEHELSGSAAELSNEPAVQAEVQRAVDHANAAVSRAESVRKVRILPRDFTEDEGEVTPTLKVRRRTIAEHFSDEIEELYAA